ncbi:unnamed protein product [Peniophora sp. CBMAI 1063]|nr:unnamed protein product [Peniophora sp. CBMAI 1063]
MFAQTIRVVLRSLIALCRRISRQSVHSLNHTTSHRGEAQGCSVHHIEHYSRIQALLIGIDRYRSVDLEALEGAVADTSSVRDYLHEQLHVSLDQIAILHNEKATRMAIIQQLHAFRARRTLRGGDPILIYFAGHGAISKAETTSDRPISMILPYDVDAVKDVDNEIDGFRGAISTRTLDDILGGLAADESIGDNITVIFDCCNSPVHWLPCEDDCATYGISSSLWAACMKIFGLVNPVPTQDSDSSRPYVLLSACGEDESAFEEGGRGGFTGALLRVLRQFGVEYVTYHDIVEYLPSLPRQTPRCEGLHVDRFIFQTRVPVISGSAFRVFAHGDHRYMINAGRLHGISTGARFSIHSSRYDTDADDSEQPLSTLQAMEVGDFSTVLSPAPDAMVSDPSLPPLCFAFQISPGSDQRKLRLHVKGDVDSPLHNLAIQGMARAGLLVDSCSSPTHADLSLCEGNHGIEYLVCSSKIKAYGLNRLCSTSPPDELHIGRVLRAAHHFFWYLHLCPTERSLRRFVGADVHKLKRTGCTANHPKTAVSTGDCNEVHMTADNITDYGMTLQSRLDIPLHVWVFYFDRSDLSIVELYRPPIRGDHRNPPLLPRGTLSIDGFGPGRGQAFTSYLRPDQDVDVGLFKIFMSTEPLDLSDVAQNSPFEGKNTRGIHLKEQEYERTWDVITIDVVQLRPETSTVPAGDASSNHLLPSLQDDCVRETGGHGSGRGD